MCYLEELSAREMEYWLYGLILLASEFHCALALTVRILS